MAHVVQALHGLHTERVLVAIPAQGCREGLGGLLLPGLDRG
ncbi:hypothetical protein GT370_05940 [Acidocella sp. MX-AZ03]|nr:hypothetical protein [Acidocella sp. MX-AZ03]WBO60346.1 hypothetical protein GT370_05940 [Acidocella sp. MX-AZ03]